MAVRTNRNNSATQMNEQKKNMTIYTLAKRQIMRVWDVRTQGRSGRWSEQFRDYANINAGWLAGWLKVAKFWWFVYVCVWWYDFPRATSEDFHSLPFSLIQKTNISISSTSARFWVFCWRESTGKGLHWMWSLNDLVVISVVFVATWWLLCGGGTLF